MIVGRTGPKDVHGASRAVDVFDVKADAEAVLGGDWCALRKFRSCAVRMTWWHPGRHGKICLGPKKVMGVFGEIHPKVLAADGR